MKDLYNLIDQQVLELLNAWNVVHDQLMHDTMLISADDYDRWDAGDDVPCIRWTDGEDAILQSLEKAARELTSAAEDAGLITLEDWRTINAILCNIGSEEPNTAALLWWRGAEEADDGNPPLCCPVFPWEAL